MLLAITYYAGKTETVQRSTKEESLNFNKRPDKFNNEDSQAPTPQRLLISISNDFDTDGPGSTV